jgi:hypothetical protein
MTESNTTAHWDLAILHDYALDKQRTLAENERAALEHTHNILQAADELFICLGGRAGRLGECIVGTGLLESTLQALRFLHKTSIPIHIFVDATTRELFNEPAYQQHYGRNLHFFALAQPDDVDANIQRLCRGQNVLVLDLHGAHDGMPTLEIQSEQDRRIARLARLFRVGVRSYAQRGPTRRYADFIEELFPLPPDTLNGTAAQPTLRLLTEDQTRYPMLQRQFGLDPSALQVVCFFQSIVRAKCYERWDEVLQSLCAYLAAHFPQQRIDFLLACGPDEDDLPPSVTKAALTEEFGEFRGANKNARILLRTTPSLRDLAILISNAALVLSNDTGPGHMAGALGIPTITPYMPGNVYSKRVWSSTLWHRGVTLEPNPYSFRELEAAVLWGNPEIINSIPPTALEQEALACLPAHLRA